MDYKQLLIYVALFVIGLIMGKVVKFNVKSRGSCSMAQSYLNQMRLSLSSDSSDGFIE